MGAEAGLVFFGVVAVAFYWILLRPVIAQQRRQRSDIQNLEVGGEVLTQAGLMVRQAHHERRKNGAARCPLRCRLAALAWLLC